MEGTSRNLCFLTNVSRRVVTTHHSENDIPERLCEMLFVYEVKKDYLTYVFISMVFFGCLRYKQAAFCYEELLLSQPTIPIHHLAYADVSASFISDFSLIAVFSYY